MKLINVPLAQSVIAVTPNRGFGYLPEAVKAVVDRYKFVEFPTDPHQLFPLDPNGSINFRHGKLDVDDRVIVIGWLQVYQSGLSISTDTDTRDSDLVLDDVLKWAAANFKFEFEIIRPIGHSSQLVVQFERKLSEFFPMLRPAIGLVQNRIDDFYLVKPPFELTSVVFHFDQTVQPGFAPSAIKIEPRSATPFERHLYYSEAPLSTLDHLELLRRFEKHCLEAGR
ncbi:MAG TPA: hypothetical protein VMV27_04340 [Candidatus Binataceae bacterium]|nr:hypothetical protein [Candidatus Binataceae bacterium]